MWKDKVVLVTGASSGIGEALARRFALDGATLVLTARREERLAKLARSLNKDARGVHIVAADLAEPGEAERVAREAHLLAQRIDVLVNNAGLGEYGKFQGQDAAALARMMRVNMESVVRLTRAALPDMLARGDGRVLNIASTAAFQPTPYMAVYGGTKAFVRNWSLALGEELRGTGVYVTCVCPGPVRTEFFDRGGYEARRGEFMRLACEADWLAERAYRALARGKGLSTPGIVNWLGAWLTRFAGLGMVTRVSARILGPRGGR